MPTQLTKSLVLSQVVDYYKRARVERSNDLALDILDGADKTAGVIVTGCASEQGLIDANSSPGVKTTLATHFLSQELCSMRGNRALFVTPQALITMWSEVERTIERLEKELSDVKSS